MIANIQWTIIALLLSGVFYYALQIVAHLIGRAHVLGV
jgi:hypothetical protein